MATVQAENIGDFVADTLKDLGQPNFTDISGDLQEYTAMDNLILSNRYELKSGGAGIQFNVLVNQSNAARHVSLGESDNVNLVDGMVQASTVWRNSQTSYMIIQQLAALNGDPVAIVDYVKQQEFMAMKSMAELFESAFWSAPSASDTKTPLGVPYWVTKNATQGFNGAVLSGYSSKAGLSPTTYPGWNSYTAPYTVVSKDDFIRKTRTARRFTKFKSPVKYPSPATGKGRGYFTNNTVLQQLEESLEHQNDNLGNDIAPKDDMVLLGRLPVQWVPFLETDTTNPFYGLNFDWFHCYIQKGWWLKRTNIINTPGQHTVSSYFMDSMYQFVCKNVREQFVISNGTSYPS